MQIAQIAPREDKATTSRVIWNPIVPFDIPKSERLEGEIERFCLVDTIYLATEFPGTTVPSTEFSGKMVYSSSLKKLLIPNFPLSNPTTGTLSISGFIGNEDCNFLEEVAHKPYPTVLLSFLIGTKNRSAATKRITSRAYAIAEARALRRRMREERIKEVSAMFTAEQQRLDDEDYLIQGQN